MLHLFKIFKVLKSEFVLIKSQCQCSNYLVTYFGTQCGVLSENRNVGIMPTVKFSKCLKHCKTLWQFARTVPGRTYPLAEGPRAKFWQKEQWHG